MGRAVCEYDPMASCFSDCDPCGPTPAEVPPGSDTPRQPETPLPRSLVNDWCDATGETLLCIDEFDEAILGIVQTGFSMHVCYDQKKCLEILQRDGTSYEDAIDHFSFNVLGSYQGDTYPVFLQAP